MSVRVLVVDDSRTVRSVISRALRLTDLPVGDILEAENGREALNVLADQWIDLVFADLNMPVMTGFELIERLQEDELLSSLPVVVVSTEGSQTRIDDLLARGVRGFIRKPFRPEQIRSAVTDLLGDLSDE